MKLHHSFIYNTQYINTSIQSCWFTSWFYGSGGHLNTNVSSKCLQLRYSPLISLYMYDRIPLFIEHSCMKCWPSSITNHVEHRQHPMGFCGIDVITHPQYIFFQTSPNRDNVIRHFLHFDDMKIRLSFEISFYLDKPSVNRLGQDQFKLWYQWFQKCIHDSLILIYGLIDGQWAV